MSNSLKKNLSEDDFKQALESLRTLITGVPIRDDSGTLIGFIEKPSLEAIKYVLEHKKNEWEIE